MSEKLAAGALVVVEGFDLWFPVGGVKERGDGVLVYDDWERQFSDRPMQEHVGTFIDALKTHMDGRFGTVSELHEDSMLVLIDGTLCLTRAAYVRGVAA